MTGKLDRLLVLTDRHQSRRPLVEVIQAAVDGGAGTIVLREKDLAADDRARLADQLETVLAPVGGRLIIAGPAGLGGGPDRRGLHLAANDPMPPPTPMPAPDFTPAHTPVAAPDSAPARDPAPASGFGAVVGRSCHGAREVVAAAAEAVDYLTVSPVFRTASKPGYGPALGLAGLRRLVALTGVPVYALGGVDEGNAAACLEAGAAGVAVMGAVMRAGDPAELVRRLVKEVGG